MAFDIIVAALMLISFLQGYNKGLLLIILNMLCYVLLLYFILSFGEGFAKYAKSLPFSPEVRLNITRLVLFVLGGFLIRLIIKYTLGAIRKTFSMERNIINNLGGAFLSVARSFFILSIIIGLFNSQDGAAKTLPGYKDSVVVPYIEATYTKFSSTLFYKNIKNKIIQSSK